MFTLTAASLATFIAFAAAQSGPAPFGFFVNNTILRTSGNYSCTYPRSVELSNGSILATTSYSGPSPSYFPIFQSDDGGASWRWISNLTDQVRGVGFGIQPAITQLPFPLGDYPTGTILAGGNIFGPNYTSIDMYASMDIGRTWKFVSNVAMGGRANTTNGATPVWEPLFYPFNNSLVAYYSDQRDPLHGQKLAHQVSYDLKTWGPVVNDVAYDQYIARPGMTNIAYIEPIKKYILVHELPIGNSSSYGANYPVYYVLADNPLEFDSSEGIGIVVDGKYAPNASPDVVWSPIGGVNGTIVVSDADAQGVFTNTAGGDPDKWEYHDTPAGAVYSRSILITKRYPDHLFIYGGNTFNGRRDNTPFSATVLSLTEVLKAPNTQLKPKINTTSTGIESDIEGVEEDGVAKGYTLEAIAK